MTEKNDKLLSVAIPCYNSQAYVRKALDSLLPAGERLEIIIVDDGSTDETATIAAEYVSAYPNIVRYVYKENGGHGDAVMYGVSQATGLYFRVLDSDDWVNTENLIRMLDRLEEERSKKNIFDMVVTNFVYEKVGCKRKKEVRFSSGFPVEKPFTWSDMKDFNIGQYLLMHSITYRLEMLRSCGLRLPKHTFYVDNLYAYYPLPFVKNIFYFDFDIYHYFIGRADQSVNEQQLYRRIDQQVLVANTMFGMHDLDKFTDKHLIRYMSQYMAVLATIVSALYVRMGGKENLKAKKKFWERIETRYKSSYRHIRSIPLIWIIRRNNPITNVLIRAGYAVARRIYHFN